MNNGENRVKQDSFQNSRFSRISQVVSDFIVMVTAYFKDIYDFLF